MNLHNDFEQLETRKTLRNRIVNIDDQDFNNLTIDVFKYQATYNPIYKLYLAHLKVKTEQINKIQNIPFLPIQFFKTQNITCGEFKDTPIVFESSGTTSENTSKHFLYDQDLYELVSRQIFESTYGTLSDFQILALLPSYLERNNSSLVYMIEHFIKKTKSPFSNFYLNNTSELLHALISAKSFRKKTILIGVTFALLDFFEENDLSILNHFPELIVMDTGGMKGRRREMLRAEVHEQLRSKTDIKTIHSEYGMTELLSQCYSKGDGVFDMNKTMSVLLRDIYDPFSVYDQHNSAINTGGINVIDLANLDSVSFIETQDLGKFGTSANTFEVLGRFDSSDVRGCNLMVLN